MLQGCQASMSLPCTKQAYRLMNNRGRTPRLFIRHLCSSMVLSLAASWGDCGGGFAPRVPSLQELMVLPCTKQAYRLVNNCERAPHFFRSFAVAQLFHGAFLGCKLKRLWRMPCSKVAKLQRAHGLPMHHAIMPPHEELWTSTPCLGRGEDAGGWLRTRRKGPPASIGAYI